MLTKSIAFTHFHFNWNSIQTLLSMFLVPWEPLKNAWCPFAVICSLPWKAPLFLALSYKWDHVGCGFQPLLLSVTFFPGCAVWLAVASRAGTEPRPLVVKAWALTTGPPGNSQRNIFEAHSPYSIYQYFIPFYRWTLLYGLLFFACTFNRHLVVHTFWLLWILLLWTVMYMSLHGYTRAIFHKFLEHFIFQGEMCIISELCIMLFFSWAKISTCILLGKVLVFIHPTGIYLKL